MEHGHLGTVLPALLVVLMMRKSGEGVTRDSHGREGGLEKHLSRHLSGRMPDGYPTRAGRVRDGCGRG
ncbi:MAG: hypothetical protein OEY05_04065 [Paracoccaceae bacterium]|nr:hypothetical protein [Paracoccaceae bacterium]